MIEFQEPQYCVNVPERKEYDDMKQWFADHSLYVCTYRNAILPTMEKQSVDYDQIVWCQWNSNSQSDDFLFYDGNRAALFKLFFC